jgi:DNA modification methylase
MTVTIHRGDCREVLRELPAESVHCVVTSPPYFGLRDYGVAGQIGLEPTPDAFVAEMVAVFAEVRRVLRKDGTVWLNLGDSYVAAGGGGESRMIELYGRDAEACRGIHSAAGNGQTSGGKGAIGLLRPKQLVGIPWRVAFALQAPQYLGRIANVMDRVWLAAMIDGEGCMFIHKRKAGTGNHSSYVKQDGTVSKYDRTQDNFGAGLEVANTSAAIVERCMAITGMGSMCRQDKDRRQPLYRWNLRSNECRGVVAEVYPHLVGKQHQARLLIGCPSSGPDAEKAHEGLMALHNGGTTHADFPAPKPLYGPGWYLRQDVIWSKLNPMPESVRDRCTKAHEYIFLLSKSERYYYDAEAIKEKVGEPTRQAASFRDGGVYTNNRSFQNSADTTKDTHGDGPLSLEGRNKRSVWEVTTQPFPEAHFATFPPALIEPCILAGCPEKVCAKCGAPWVREVERIDRGWDGSKYGERAVAASGGAVTGGTAKSTLGSGNGKLVGHRETIGFSPSCQCNAGTTGGTVLDPFGGAGTTALVADRNGRNAILIELNPEYADMAERRINGDCPLFAEVR